MFIAVMLICDVFTCCVTQQYRLQLLLQTWHFPLWKLCQFLYVVPLLHINSFDHIPLMNMTFISVFKCNCLLLYIIMLNIQVWSIVCCCKICIDALCKTILLSIRRAPWAVDNYICKYLHTVLWWLHCYITFMEMEVLF